MFNFDHIGIYDLLLVGTVTLMGTGTAYLKSPFWKSFLMLFPLPFSLAFLAVGQPMNPACLLGLVLLLGYYFVADFLYNRCGLNIVPAIVLAAAAYCTAGGVIKPWLLQSESFFWLVLTGVLLFSLLVYRFTPVPEESGSKTSLPVYLKVPALLTVILFVVGIKMQLQGFVTMFPMVGVIGTYESRRCLKTVYRQVPLYAITFMPLAAVCYLTQTKLGVPAALGLGWCAYLITLWLLRKQWFPTT